MSRLFISHSSKNDDWAIALKDWLVREGWSGENDIFLDLDPSRGIAAGQRWQHALEDAATRCEAVLFLVSEQWLASKWCHDEYRLAETYSKKLFALLVDTIALDRLPGGLTAQWQVVSLLGEPSERFLVTHPYTRLPAPVNIAEAALASLKRGLRKAGIGAETFEIVPDARSPLGWRAVYRGLEALEPEDAAVFFGRNADIVRGIDALRGLAARKAPRLLVVLGASGAGKSSFLRAGLWPRLRRDDSQWLPLRAIRAGRGGAIEGDEGLLVALEEAHARFGLPVSRAALRKHLATPALFVDLLRSLRQVAARRAVITAPPFPLPIICLDQGEELFSADAGAESATLLALARHAIDADEALLLVTIRSDSYGFMQSAAALAGVDQQPMSLAPVPQGEIARIIREPAELLRQRAGPSAPLFDPSVVARLQGEVEGEADALPLLAFVLQRLMREHASAGTIGVAELDATGGVAAAIEMEAEAALVDAGFKSERAERREALRRLFVPRLARIDRETKATQRRTSRQIELPSDLLPLAQALTRRRLLVMKQTGMEGDVEGAATLEVAHEALLRRWPTLVDLLAEDRDALLLLDGVLSAAADWIRADDAAKPDFLAHRGSRLADVEGLAARGGDWARELAPAQAYLVACHALEQRERVEREAALEREQARLIEVAAAQARQAVLQRRTQWALLLVALVTLTAAGLFVWQATNFRQVIAEREERVAQGQKDVVDARKKIADDGMALRHERANVLAGLARSQAAGRRLDIAFRLAVQGVRLDSDLPSKAITGASAAAELAAILSGSAERMIFSGHDDMVNSAAFSPDGRRIVTASDDKTARIWDVATGQTLAVLRGHMDKVTSAAFSPDGRRIVTASDDKTARIWDVATGQVIAVLSGHASALYSAAFSPDGLRIVTASNDETARLWNGVTGKPIAVLEGHEHWVVSAAFSPDGLRIVTASTDHTARVWDGMTGEAIAVLRGHEDFLTSAAFSADGRRIITTSTDKTARVWDSVTGHVIFILRGHTDSVLSAVFSPDGRRIVTTSWDKTARLWDGPTGQAIAVLSGDEDEVLSVTFSGDGRHILTASRDGTARLWDGEGGHATAVLQGHEGSVFSAVFSRDGTRIVTASADGTARTWDVAPGQAINVLRGHESTVNSAAFSPDGTRILTASDDMTARLWNAATGAIIAVLRGHTDKVTSAAFSPDGTRIVTASDDGTARSWDGTTGRLITILGGEDSSIFKGAFSPKGTRIVTVARDGTEVWDSMTGQVVTVLSRYGRQNSAAFSPDGQRIVTGFADGTARVWDGATGRAMTLLAGHEGEVNSADFSRDGTRIVTASKDGTGRLWDGATGQAITVLRGHGDNVASACFSSDGRRVLTASYDKTARVWDGLTGQPISVLRGDQDFEAFATFSLDGRRVVTASFDKIQLWDGATGQVIAVLPGHEGGVQSAAFSPDGTRLVTASQDGTEVWDVHLSTMPDKALIKEVCTNRIRGVSVMTRDEMRLAGYSDNEPGIDVCKDGR